MYEIIGYWFAILSALFVLAILISVVAYVNIMASKYFLDMCGGWKMFIKYRRWYAKNKDT